MNFSGIFSRHFLKKNGAWIGFFLLVLLMTLATQGQFLSARNLTNLIRQTSINGILAAAMTLVILTGGIDLSIGSTVALCGIITGVAQVYWQWGTMGIPGLLGSLGLALATGALVGLCIGVLIAWLGIAPFIITLGMMVIGRGLAMIISNGSSISPMGDALLPLAGAYLSPFWTFLLIALLAAALIYNFRKKIPELIFPIATLGLMGYSFSKYHGFPFLALFLFVVLVIISLLLNHTPLGRSIYAVGSNDQAAFWSGVAVKRVKILVYTITGFLAGLSGVLLTARLNGADPNAGQLFELDAIAAVVIGGTSLKGGSGTIMGSLVGALMIATLNNGMDLMGVPSFYQMVFKGIIIIVAVGLDRGQRT